MSLNLTLIVAKGTLWVLVEYNENKTHTIYAYNSQLCLEYFELTTLQITRLNYVKHFIVFPLMPILSTVYCQIKFDFYSGSALPTSLSY